MAGGNIPGNLRGIFVAAGQQFHIPPSVLAGVASVETNLGQNRGPSSTGALGLMQFEPGTARSIGINPNNDRQAIFGAAKLLTQYGFHQNPLRAIGAYNGGPGNPQMGYANQVMSEASRLRAELGGAAASQGQPQPQGLGQMPSMSVTTPTFNRQGFDQAQRRYLTGTFLSQTAQNNPWGTTGGSAGLAPLFAAGALTTTPPNMADFQGSKTLKVAQSSLQGLAQGAGLSTHPMLKTAADARIAASGSPLAKAVLAANQMSDNHFNYEWGGGHNPQFAPTHGTGHGSGVGTGFDCSGAISEILHAAGKLNTPLVSGQFMSFGQAGPGGRNDITIYASPTHVFAKIGGKYFGTSASNRGGGAGWFSSADTSGFVVRHVSLA